MKKSSLSAGLLVWKNNTHKGNNVNWDDMKYFLAVCRTGSIRAAARQLDVNHATVSRRINSFEQSLNQRLFDRTAQGYVCTKFGENIYAEASHLEERLNQVERKAAAQENELSGEIRITAADVLLHHLLMPVLAEFANQYPLIDLAIIDSSRNFNLANREADIAVRICQEPPEHLIGKKVANMHRACYVSKSTLLNAGEKTRFDPSTMNWIGWSDRMRRPVGVVAREYPRFDSKHSILSASIQALACKMGMGVAVLPCFMGDSDPDLTRIAPYTSEHKYDLWLLHHPDVRDNVRIKTLIAALKQYLDTQKSLIEGRHYLTDAD